MSLEIVPMEYQKISNTKLRNFTEQIFKQGLNVRKALTKVAIILVQIEETKCYEMDGFTSVQDYAEKVFGWKTANTYAMLKVGKDYIDRDTMESVLPHETGKDYNTSQLQALLPLKSVETAQDLAEQSIIDPSMSVREIKHIVKNYKNAFADDSSENESEAVETDTDNNESDATVNDSLIETLYAINICKDADGNILFYVNGVQTDYDSVIGIVNNIH